MEILRLSLAEDRNLLISDSHGQLITVARLAKPAADPDHPPAAGSPLHLALRAWLRGEPRAHTTTMEMIPWRKPHHATVNDVLAVMR